MVLLERAAHCHISHGLSTYLMVDTLPAPADELERVLAKQVASLGLARYAPTRLSFDGLLTAKRQATRPPLVYVL